MLGSRFTATRSYVEAQKLLRNWNEHLRLGILISKAFCFDAHQIFGELARADVRSDEAFNLRNVSRELAWSGFRQKVRRGLG